MQARPLVLACLTASSLALLGCESPSEEMQPGGPYRIGSYLTDHVRQGDRWEYAITRGFQNQGGIRTEDTGRIEVEVAGWNRDSTELRLEIRASGFRQSYHLATPQARDTLALDTSFTIAILASASNGGEVKVQPDPEPAPYSTGDLGFSWFFLPYLFSAEAHYTSQFNSRLPLLIADLPVQAYKPPARIPEAHYVQAPPILAYAENIFSHHLAPQQATLRLKSLNGKPVYIDSVNPHRIGAYITDHIRKGDRWEYEILWKFNTPEGTIRQDSGQVALEAMGWNGDATELQLDARLTGTSIIHDTEKNRWDTVPAEAPFRILVTGANKHGKEVETRIEPPPNSDEWIYMRFSGYFSKHLFPAEAFFADSLQSPLAVSVADSAARTYRPARAPQADYLRTPPVLAYAIGGRTTSFTAESGSLRLKAFNGKPVGIEFPSAVRVLEP